MTEIIKRHKALSVSPLKASAPIGATLAFLGIDRSMPMLHGSQGCTAFGKVFFVRHFREPIPLQTTAMDQIAAVMGSEENVVEGLKAVAEKSKPALIGLPTTGLSETQGSDVMRAVREFRAAYPHYDTIPVVAVNTPDFSGCLEWGYAEAVRRMIDELVPTTGTRPGRRPRQVNILAGSLLTPGDVEALKDLVEAFGLRPVVLPDLSDSLDGRLTESDFSAVTVGGTPLSELATLGDAAATLVIGPSLGRAADLLAERTGVVAYRFEHLLGLDAVDALMGALSQIAQTPVPARQERERARLQDAMLDTHFMLGATRVAIAADGDLLNAWSQFLAEMGAEVVAAVAPARAPALASVAAERVKIGDLEDLEQLATATGVDLVVGNSHAVASAERLGAPILRVGFPLYDQVGGFQRPWIGYVGARQALFELANLRLAHHHELPPYRSIYAQKLDYQEQEHGPSTPSAAHH